MFSTRLTHLVAAFVAFSVFTADATGNGSSVEYCVPSGMYGDGSDGDLTITEDVELTQDMDLRNLTVQPGAILDTAGHAIRVCGTLINDGFITDLQSGGGQLWFSVNPARGQDPCQDSEGPPVAEDGTCTCGGLPPAYAEAGLAGVCGGGGGGGGGAWDETDGCLDVDGGDGGSGGIGGNGGGYVRIYAFRLDNEGIIHADGSNGGNASNGEDGQYLCYGNPEQDIASGGGGGGAGGAGGDGGTVEVYYAHLGGNGVGTLSAAGGVGGLGADGGTSGTALVGTSLLYTDHWYEDSFPGSNGYPAAPEPWRGGDAGNGEHRQHQRAGNGLRGGNGPAGNPGQTFANCIPYAYELTWLGPDQNHWSVAQSITESGLVVGFAETSGGDNRAFRWIDGQFLPLSGDTYDASWAFDANDLGQIVGCIRSGADVSPFLWLPEAAYDLRPGLNVLPGESCCGQAINSHGQIAGFCGDRDSAYLWLPEQDCDFSQAGAHDITEFIPFAVDAAAYGINDQGEIAGWAECESYAPPSPPRRWHETWMWHCDAPYAHDPLPLSPTTPSRHARDINNNSEIVAAGSPSNGYAAAVCLPGEQDWNCRTLPGLGDGPSGANAINEAGDIVGWAVIPSGAKHACLWKRLSENSWMILDLNDFVDEHSPTLTEATDLNDAGRIVGNGYSPGVGNLAFMLAPAHIRIAGDFNGDLNVDLKDYESFPACLRGPLATLDPPSQACLYAFDFDFDSDIDLQDFGEFQNLLSGNRD